MSISIKEKIFPSRARSLPAIRTKIYLHTSRILRGSLLVGHAAVRKINKIFSTSANTLHRAATDLFPTQIRAQEGHRHTSVSANNGATTELFSCQIVCAGPFSLGRITLGKAGCLLIPLSMVSHPSIHPQVGILQSSPLKTISPQQWQISTSFYNCCLFTDDPESPHQLSITYWKASREARNIRKSMFRSRTANRDHCHFQMLWNWTHNSWTEAALLGEEKGTQQISVSTMSLAGMLGNLPKYTATQLRQQHHLLLDFSAQPLSWITPLVSLQSSVVAVSCFAITKSISPYWV